MCDRVCMYVFGVCVCLCVCVCVCVCVRALGAGKRVKCLNLPLFIKVWGRSGMAELERDVLGRRERKAGGEGKSVC